MEQEEEYTSKADFFADDMISTYKAFDYKHYTFSGKRVERGLYRSKSGVYINAAVNGSLNILRKSNVVIFDMQSKGYLSPIKLKVS